MAKGSGNTRYYRSNVGQEASAQLRTMLYEIFSDGYSKMTPIKVGGVEKRMKDDADRRGIEIANEMYMTAAQVRHAERDSKINDGVAVDPEHLIAFPVNRFGMELHYNTEDKNYVYFDGSNKYVVKPSERIKLPNGKTKVVNFITAKIAEAQEFRMQKYEVVKKK